VIMPIWNAWSFFSMYARADGVAGEYNPMPGKDAPVLDRYILAKTRELVASVTESLDGYELSLACGEVRTFLDAFNNWYIRRSRGRFWSPVTGDPAADADKFIAYDTMYTVLHILSRTVAPLLPLVSEQIYLGLVGSSEKSSVHLTDWPSIDELPDDSELVREMDLVRDVCTGALGVRNEEGLRVRLPLASLTIAGPGASKLAEIKGLFELVQDEVNVKSIAVDDDVESLGRFELFVNARAAGPRLGKQTKDVIAASKKGDWKDLGNGSVEVAGHVLEGQEFELRLVPREGLEGKVTLAIPSSGVVIALEVALTPELEAEGLARDVVRQIQETRKAAQLGVSDRIQLQLELPDSVTPAVEAHRDYIMAQTLADSVDFNTGSEGSYSHEATLMGQRVCIHVTRIKVVQS
jgi:isoleucyl-tRNA synthetase